jgi:hypothetical protein
VYERTNAGKVFVSYWKYNSLLSRLETGCFSY